MKKVPAEPIVELIDLTPEQKRELEFRRGYKEGYLAALSTLGGTVRRTWEWYYDMCWSFAHGELIAWARTGPLHSFNFPPQFRPICYYCEVNEATERDHIIPKSRGGSDEPENLVPTCQQCNRGKHNRTPEEWTDRWYEREEELDQWPR